MSTEIRPELSKKSKYWISKHRYYELKHYCLQYHEWKQLYSALEQQSGVRSIIKEYSGKRNAINDTTGKIAMMKAECAYNIKLVEDAAKEADKDLAYYILVAVTEERSYTYMSTILRVPCGKDMFYDRYRKFYWILSNTKGL